MYRFVALGIVLLSACVSQPTHSPANDQQAAVSTQLVLMRHSVNADAKNHALIYDVTESPVRLVAALGANQKVVIETRAGSRRFMISCADHATFLNAELAANKRYYSFVGAEGEGDCFAFMPVRQTTVGERAFTHPNFFRHVNQLRNAETLSSIPDLNRAEQQAKQFTSSAAIQQLLTDDFAPSLQ